MLDTISALIEPKSGMNVLSEGWKCRRIESSPFFRLSGDFAVTTLDKQPAIKGAGPHGWHIFQGWFRGVQFTKIEGSIPRLVHGHNGRVLLDQYEVDRGLAAFRDLVDGLFPDGWVLRRFSRVDLAWQFPGDTADWSRVFRYARHPAVREAAKCYPDNTGLTWGKGDCMIRLYDKGEEMRHKGVQVPEGPGPVRLEVQFRGSRLVERFRSDGWAAVSDFSNLYRVYKEFFMLLQGCRVPIVKTPWGVIFELEGSASALGWSPLEAALRNVTAPTRRRRLAEYSTFVSKGLRIDFRDFLGPERPCVVADVPEVGQGTLFPGGSSDGNL